MHCTAIMSPPPSTLLPLTSCLPETPLPPGCRMQNHRERVLVDGKAWCAFSFLNPQFAYTQHSQTLTNILINLINCWSSVVASVVLPQLCNLHCQLLPKTTREQRGVYRGRGGEGGETSSSKKIVSYIHCRLLSLDRRHDVSSGSLREGVRFAVGVRVLVLFYFVLGGLHKCLCANMSADNSFRGTHVNHGL